MEEKTNVRNRLSKRYFGKEVENYETSRLADARDRDVFQREVDIVQGFLKNSLNGPLLDVACGTGRVFPYYGDREIYGIDISKDMLKIAKKRKPSARLKVSDAEKIPYTDNKFSVVITSRFIMHTPEYEKVISEMSRVVKKGGSLIVDFPNKFSLSYFTTKYRLKNKSGTLRYFNLFTYSQIRDIAKKNNLQIVEVKAKTFVPAKILPEKLHNLTKKINHLLSSAFPLISTPLYIRFVKI